MISYDQFKKIFNKLEIESEIEIYFNNDEQYTMVKKDKIITFGKNESGLINDYNNLEETSLKNEWNNINDVVINFAFSVVDDKNKITEIYGIKL